MCTRTASPERTLRCQLRNEDALNGCEPEVFEDKQLSVDIFAIAPAGSKESKRRGSAEAGLSTTFAVGRRADVSLPKGPAGERGDHRASWPRDAMVRRGDDVLVESVVRTRKVGHFFPGGTIDASTSGLNCRPRMIKGRRFSGAARLRMMAKAGRSGATFTNRTD